MGRLLIYTPYSHWTNDTTIASYLAAIFGHERWTVDLLTCGGILNSCDILQTSRNPEIVGKSKEVVCHECRERRRHYSFVKPENLLVLENYVDRGAMAAFSDRLNAISDVPALLRIEAHGCKLYDIAASSLNVHFRKDALEFQTEEEVAVLRKYLLDAWISLNAADAFFAQRSYDAVIIRNGRMNTTYAFTRILQQRGIGYHALDRYPKWDGLGGLSLIKDGTTLDWFRTRQPFFRKYETVGLPAAARPVLYRLLASHQKPDRSRLGFDFTWKSTGELTAHYGITGKYVMLLPSSTDEVAVALEHDAGENRFPDQRVFIEQACADFSQQTEYTLVVRGHPNAGSRLSLGRNESDVEFYADLASRYRETPSIKIIQPDEQVNTFSLSFGAEAALVYLTSMATELPCFGIPVIEAGGWWLKSLSYIWHLNTTPIVEFVRSAIAENESRHEQNAIIALRHLYINRAIANFNCSAIEWKHWGRGELKGRTPAEIVAIAPDEAARICKFVGQGLDDLLECDTATSSTSNEIELGLYASLRVLARRPLPSDAHVAVLQRLDHAEFLSRFQKAPVAQVAHTCAANPVVSVLVTTYNHGPFIAKTLDSILAQEVSFPFEICVGDDDSTDGTREVCLEYAKKYPARIRLFLTPRANNIRIGGNATGRFNFTNLYFESKGRYLAWCEGDDYWTEPKKLARQVAFLSENPEYNLTFHNAKVVYQDGGAWNARHLYSEFPWCKMDKSRATYSVEDLIASPLCPTASVVFRRPVDPRLPLWFFHVPSADIPIEVFAARGGKIHNFQKSWSVYRKHAAGASAGHRGNLIHVGRIMTYLGLFCDFKTEALTVLATVLEKHASELQPPVQPYAPEIWRALIEQAMRAIDEAHLSNSAAAKLRTVLTNLPAAGAPDVQSMAVVKPAAVARPHQLRVLFVAHGPGQVNGPNIWLTRLLPALKQRGIFPRVLMIMSHQGPCLMADALQKSGIPCDAVPLAYTEDLVRTIAEYVQKHGCEIVVPNLDVAAYFAARFIKQAGIPTVGVLHSDDDFHRDLFDEFVAHQDGRHLSALVTVSAFQYEAAQAAAHGSTIVVQAPYGAPLPSASAAFSRQPFRVVYVGRLVEEQKRISDTVTAMIALMRRRPEVEFVICGDGTARPAVAALIQAAGMQQRIKLLGNLPAAEVQSVLLRSQALVLLSDYEGIPIALMEAMGAGVVPICLKIRSGIGDIVRDGENGLLVADRGESFVTAAERLIKDQALWARCSAEARSTIERQYSVAANANVWSKLLEDLYRGAAKSDGGIQIPEPLILPPVRLNPKGIAREDRRKPASSIPLMNTVSHPFTNPALEINNVDLYWVRASILRAVQQAVPRFYGTLLDIGCGVMPYRDLITKAPSRVTRYIGLDMESEIYRADVDLRWDGRTIPLADSSVDSVMATEVLEHCPEPLVVLKEARRVLKPGGVFFFTVPYIWPLHDAPYDFFRYTPFALEKLLGDAGFGDITVQALGGWNASLAQMIGLWIKRAPMAAETRNKMAQQLWPLYQELLKTDALPSDPRAGNTMATGWTGFASAPKVKPAGVAGSLVTTEVEPVSPLFSNGSERSSKTVRQLIDEVQPLRSTVSTIEPATTVVATFSKVLGTAVKYYTTRHPALPEFLVVDWRGGRGIPEVDEGQAAGLKLIPISEKARVAERKLCLFAKPAAMVLEPLGLRDLATVLFHEGFESGLLVDGAVMEAASTARPNPQFVKARLQDIQTVYDALADEVSRDHFLRAMKSIETGDPGCLKIAPYAQYDHPLVKAAPGDLVIEGGVLNGGTTNIFAEAVGAEGRVVAFEPLAEAHRESSAATASRPNVVVEHAGLWSARSNFYIENRGGASRVVPTPNERTEQCHCVDLDGYLTEKKITRCDVIKLDIEGAEEECLKGAMQTIRTHRPKLQLSLYHKPEHYLDIPLRLIRENLGYTLFIGHHLPWYWETVLYALPQRLVKSSVPSMSQVAGSLPLVVVRSHESNYSETFIEDHVRHLSNNVILLYGFPFPRFRAGDCSVLSESFETRLKKAMAERAFTAELWREYNNGLAAFLKRCGARVALLESGVMGGFLHEACEQAALPYVVHFHGVDAFGREILSQWTERYRNFFKTAASLVVVSKAMRARLLELGAPKERVVLGPYGVATDVARQAQPSKASPQFVAVGRFVEKKAPHLTLQAFAVVHRRVPDARLVMAGDGPLLDLCRRSAKDLKISDAVSFVGVQSREDVSRLMAGSRAFVQHSITAENGDSEGLPLAVLEAGAHGLPVVSTVHAGIPDAVRHGIDGYLVQEKDVDAMAAAMLRLAQDPVLAANLGASFQSRVQHEYSRQISLSRLLAVLQAAADSCPENGLGKLAPTPAAKLASPATPTSDPRVLIAEDRNNAGAYLTLGKTLAETGAFAEAYCSIGEAQRLAGPTAETTDLLAALEDQGALGESTVEAYRRRAGWLPKRKSARLRRILVITNLLPPQEMGGFGRTMWEFGRELLARGHTVQVLTADMPHLLRKPSPDHHAFESHVQRSLRLAGDWKEGRAVWEPDEKVVRATIRSNEETVLAAAQSFRPDVVMVGNLDFLGHRFVQQILNQGIPVLHRLGNGHPGYDVKTAPKSPLYCVAGCSEWVNAMLRTNGYEIARYAVLPPGSPLSECFRSFSPDRSKLRIAFAGLLLPYKGAHVLVEALGYLRRAGIDFQCTLAGDSTSPDYLEQLRAVAAKNDFLDRVEFAGFLAKRELAALYARCNVLVFPSVFEEPFGKTQIEAMAAGLTVVSSGSGGSREIIRDAETGLFFTNNDARDLAEKLLALHRQPAIAEKIALAGQKDAFRFTTSASVDRLEGLFEELIAVAGAKSAKSAAPALRVDAPAAL